MDMSTILSSQNDVDMNAAAATVIPSTAAAFSTLYKKSEETYFADRKAIAVWKTKQDKKDAEYDDVDDIYHENAVTVANNARTTRTSTNANLEAEASFASAPMDGWVAEFERLAEAFRTVTVVSAKGEQGDQQDDFTLNHDDDDNASLKDMIRRKSMKLLAQAAQIAFYQLRDFKKAKSMAQLALSILTTRTKITTTSKSAKAVSHVENDQQPTNDESHDDEKFASKWKKELIHIRDESIQYKADFDLLLEQSGMISNWNSIQSGIGSPNRIVTSTAMNKNNDKYYNDPSFSSLSSGHYSNLTLQHFCVLQGDVIMLEQFVAVGAALDILPWTANDLQQLQGQTYDNDSTSAITSINSTSSSMKKSYSRQQKGPRRNHISSKEVATIAPYPYAHLLAPPTTPLGLACLLLAMWTRVHNGDVTKIPHQVRLQLDRIVDACIVLVHLGACLEHIVEFEKGDNNEEDNTNQEDIDYEEDEAKKRDEKMSESIAKIARRRRKKNNKNTLSSLKSDTTTTSTSSVVRNNYEKAKQFGLIEKTVYELAKISKHKRLISVMDRFYQNTEYALSNVWCRCGSRKPWIICHAGNGDTAFCKDTRINDDTYDDRDKNKKHLDRHGSYKNPFTFRLSPFAICPCPANKHKPLGTKLAHYYTCCWLSRRRYYLDDATGDSVSREIGMLVKDITRGSARTGNPPPPKEEIVKVIRTLPPLIMKLMASTGDYGRDKTKVGDWDPKVYAGCMERTTSTFLWTDVHWMMSKAELVQRVDEWNAALEQYCDDEGLEGSEREAVIKKHTANPYAPCGNSSCDTYETQLKQFHCCSRCKAIAYCSRQCQVQHWKTHKVACRPT